MWVADKLVYQNESDFIRAYKGSEIVWVLPSGSYYIKWTPSSAEGQFNIDGTTYDLSAFGGIYYWSTGVINRDAFSNNGTIQSIETNATSIGSSAFQSCSSLSQISLPMCSYINRGALGHCKSLSQVSIPVCSYIGVTVFAYCRSLSQLSLPVCSIIRDYAFIGCSSLSRITIGYSGVCSLDSSVFYKTKITSSTGSIYIPASLVDAYKSAINWSMYSSQIFPIPE